MKRLWQLYNGLGRRAALYAFRGRLLSRGYIVLGGGWMLSLVDIRAGYS